jgi:CRP-like cAMP-binding protein
VRAEAVDVAPVERVLALRTFPVFEGLSPSELAVMAEHVRPRRFEPGDAVFRPDAPVRALHFVVQGRVALLRHGRARRNLGPHEVVGGLASLMQDPAGQHAVATEPTVTLQLDRDEMAEVFEDNFPIFLGVLRVMARMLVTARKKLGNDGGHPPSGALHWMRELGELGLVERILVLRRTMDFAGAEIEALADLAQEAEEIRLAPGRTLWRVGDTADHSLILISGRVVCYAETGQELDFGPGSVVGGVDSLCDDPRWYTAVARGEVRGLRIEAQDLLDVIEDNMAMGMNLLRVIAGGIHQIDQRVSDPGKDQPIA